MVMRTLSVSVLVAALFVFAGCSGTAPNTDEKKMSLQSDADAALKDMASQDPGIPDFVHKAYAYAVFPTIAEGGFIVGGASGKGAVYEKGNLIGWSEMSMAEAGLLAGGKTFSELLVFENKGALDRFTASQYSMGADISAVVLKAGASATVQFKNGVAVFTNPKGGLMGGISVTGQKFNYVSATQPAPQ